MFALKIYITYLQDLTNISEKETARLIDSPIIAAATALTLRHFFAISFSQYDPDQLFGPASESGNYFCY
jgi:hypothetical protein